MNAQAFRHFFEYHFSENRSLWEMCIKHLTFEQFSQEVDYSHGSIRNQVVHIMSADDTWFSPLLGKDVPWALNPADFQDWDSIRTRWDALETSMRQYLSNLDDKMLIQKPYTQEEDRNLILWQVLLHVVNHGTDHRAQILRILHDLGVKTTSQDYIFYVYDHP